MKLLKYIVVVSVLIQQLACKKYLDIVPDYTPTIDNAFALRAQAKKYLFTCYSFLPRLGEYSTNFTFLGSREIVTTNFSTPLVGTSYQNFIDLAADNQQVGSPIANYWDGENTGTQMFIALRDCNIFLENIGRVPDITDEERKQWIAEVKTLKAYYHFFLLRMYGPIPVIRTNLPISASVNEVKVFREPVDDVVAYIGQLIDESVADLPLRIDNVTDEMGRVTKTIALSVKAQALVLGASPLFNGNAGYAGFKNKDGKPLVSTEVSSAKWTAAAEACKQAIDMAEQAGHQLHYFNKPFSVPALTPETQKEMDIRGAITEDFNMETIWGFKNAQPNTLQSLCTPYSGSIGSTKPGASGIAMYGANMEACEQFYSKNGVPIGEDKNWDYANRYTKTGIVGAADRSRMYPNFETALFNLDREPRFYADLNFIGSSFFYAQYMNASDLMYYAGFGSVTDRFSITGYWPKKLVNYKNAGLPTTAYSIVPYVWPAIRLSEIYLMYAESLNEANGPSEEAYRYVDSVRARAGIGKVVDSWSTFSTNPSKPATKEGLRDIIQQETQIEFMFEGNNYWNLRRWKRLDLINRPITGWNVFDKTRSGYYTFKLLGQPASTSRCYLQPIKEYNLSVNHNLVQNPLW
ncbi:RagB/SusD family nutrient uptake outer membrane protein [Niabella hirudinis]|uniref:RagB/SusD family nutrient uptake outer membrane protein n=1 Tax=Niabella hirudinis TaxID=1285929 RepID=UPI003EBC8B5F